MSQNGQRYLQRQDGFNVEMISVDVYEGIPGATQIVALNASGYVDSTLIRSIAGGVVTSVNAATGALIVSGGFGVQVTTSGQIILIAASGANSDVMTRLVSAVPGTPTSGQLVMIYTAETVEVFPANFGSPQAYGSCGTNPSALATYSLYKNTTLVGNVAISIAGTFAFTTIGGLTITLNPGDRFTMVAPGVPDATLADVGITLVGIRGTVIGPVPALAPVITWRGAWNSGTAYNLYDMVSIAGSSYIAIAANTNQSPPNVTYWNLVAAGGNSGSAVISPNWPLTSSNTNWSNMTLVGKMSGQQLLQLASSWKFTLTFLAGSPVIGNMVVLRTLLNSGTVIDSTAVTIGGVSNPTLASPAFVTSDAINLQLDRTHDYYIMIYFTSAGANTSVNIGGAGTAGFLTGDTSGNSTTVSTIPSLTITGAPLGFSSVTVT